MTLLLAGDIGGTKTILRLLQVNGTPVEHKSELEPLHEAQYVSRNYPSLVPIVETFLGEAEQKLGPPQRPEKACFGIAGPVIDGTCKLTNLAWPILAERSLEQTLHIPQVALINDFEAVGYGVLGLEAADLQTLQPGDPRSNAPIAVIGAGTGLGQGFLTSNNGVYTVYGTEGGHTDFAPRTELEFQLSRYLLEHYQLDRISVERIVSGRGIVAIYQFLRDRTTTPELPSVAAAVRAASQETGSHEKSVDPASAISIAAIEQQDALSSHTMQLFIEAYGTEAGNLALKILPRSGLYIAGGIAAKNLPLFDRYGFLDAFVNKGRMRGILEKIPVHIVLNPHVGLIGSAIRASRL